MSQLALVLSDWLDMASAPRDARWIEGWNGQPVIMHFAQDLSGSDQPAFSGWYWDAGCYFANVYPPPRRWRYLPAEQDRTLNPWHKPYE